jgi:hypothetical protein
MPSDPSVPELSFLDDLVDLAKSDLESTRSLLQRLLAVTDGILASAVTLTGLFAGLAFTNKSAAIALCAIPLLLVLGYLDGVQWAHFRRTAARVRALERLIHAYAAVLRESGPVRPQVVRTLRQHVDRYQFGSERAFEPVPLKRLWAENRGRVRWWLYGLLALVLLLFSIWLVPGRDSSDARVCARDAAGSVVQFDDVPVVVTGSMTLVPCSSVVPVSRAPS